MQVPRIEGVAIHDGPESCAVPREGYGEALTGECIGQPLSRERRIVPGADAVRTAEGKMDGRASRERPADPAWSQTLACAHALCTGTGRSHGWPAAHAPTGPHREGEEPKPMMHGREKSHSAIVAVKRANKTSASKTDVAEPVEPRAGIAGNADEQRTLRTQGRARVTQALGRVRQAAKLRKKEKLTALTHHISTDLLREAFLTLKRDAAPGVDGLTWQDYEAGLEGNLADLHARVHRGAYRAQPARRTYIPKTDGRQRPLARCRRRLRLGDGAGGQDRPEGDRRRAELSLRGGVPRLQRSLPRPSGSPREPGVFGPDAASTMRWTRSRSGSRPDV